MARIALRDVTYSNLLVANAVGADGGVFAKHNATTIVRALHRLGVGYNGAR